MDYNQEKKNNETNLTQPQEENLNIRARTKINKDSTNINLDVEAHGHHSVRITLILCIIVVVGLIATFITKYNTSTTNTKSNTISSNSSIENEGYSTKVSTYNNTSAFLSFEEITIHYQDILSSKTPVPYTSEDASKILYCSELESELELEKKLTLESLTEIMSIREEILARSPNATLFYITGNDYIKLSEIQFQQEYTILIRASKYFEQAIIYYTNSDDVSLNEIYKELTICFLRLCRSDETNNNLEKTTYLEKAYITNRESIHSNNNYINIDMNQFYYQNGYICSKLCQFGIGIYSSDEIEKLHNMCIESYENVEYNSPYYNLAQGDLILFKHEFGR